MRVKTSDGHGWRTGRVLSTGFVALDQTGEVIPPGRIRAVVHYPREQTPHEGPAPQEMGWWVLLGAVFFEEKRSELEVAAEWRDPSGVMIRPSAATPSVVSAVVVSATNGALALAATAASGE